MTKKEIEFRDPIIEKVVDQLVSRSDVGFKKYNVTLDGDNSSLLTWLQHLQLLVYSSELEVGTRLSKHQELPTF